MIETDRIQRETEMSKGALVRSREYYSGSWILSCSKKLFSGRLDSFSTHISWQRKRRDDYIDITKS